MKMTKYRLFMAWEHEQEEAWLAEMEADGWHLDTVQMIRYEFVKGEPDQYQYRLEMLPELPNHPDSVRYLEFMEETGAEAIASYLRWVYFRKKNDGTPFEIYSDNASRIRHLRRILYLLIPALCAELLATLSVVLSSGLMWPGLVCMMLAVAIASGIVQINRQIKKLEKGQNICE